MLASFPGSSRIRADGQQQKLRTRPGFFVSFFLSFILSFLSADADGSGVKQYLDGTASCLLPVVVGMSGLAILAAVSCRRC